MVLAAARYTSGDAARDARTPARECFAFDEADGLCRVPDDHPSAIVLRDRLSGWQSLATTDEAVRSFLDLYLPLCGASCGAPVAVGHLGQSLDGFIATHTGESQWITGHENLLHMHRLRAICDAVIVGAGTVAADDPQLTTRLVSGPSPLRVVLDPSRRLEPHYRVFSDTNVPTLYLCERPLLRPGEARWGNAEVAAVDGPPGRLDLRAVLRLLRERGCGSVFVEGGGVTVSSFLEAKLLDRLHVTVAPLIIGDGRPAIRLPAPETLASCERPSARIFRMGGDVLFDCDLRVAARVAASADDVAAAAAPSVARVL